MTWRIFRNAFLVGLAVLLLCMAVFFGVMLSAAEQRAYSDLELEAGYIVHGLEESGAGYFDTLESRDRVTWVDSNGAVLYDSAADAGELENHLDREEIASALKTGMGQSSHFSSTFLEKTLYYAVLAGDGTVVRVSCKQSSAAAFVIGLVQPILWVVALALILSGSLASRLAKQITRPINELDLDRPEDCKVYKELTPLVNRLREQNRTIRSQMDELGRKRREFEAITDNMSEGFLFFDGKGAVLSGNSSAMELLRRGGGEIRAAASAACAGEHSRQELALDGQCFQILANPVVTSGQVTGAVVIIMDVTERERMEEMRREFSANVSHELKTPLTSISGFAELMKEGIVPPEKTKEFAGDIYRESRRLIALVDDIIRLSRLDEESAVFEKESVELYSLSEEVLESLGPAAVKKVVELRLTGDHAEIPGVRQIISEMIFNLCDNAVKYNKDNGRVDVSIKDGGKEASVTVADTGIGIPYAHQSRVFERFYRVDKSHSREIGGTGLGLSIVKHGAQYHDARVELESVPDKGTRITVIFKKEIK